jgi:hypothetical protein
VPITHAGHHRELHGHQAHAARTLTSASPGPGEPAGAWITASTSGPPKRRRQHCHRHR